MLIDFKESKTKIINKREVNNLKQEESFYKNKLTIRKLNSAFITEIKIHDLKEDWKKKSFKEKIKSYKEYRLDMEILLLLNELYIEEAEECKIKLKEIQNKLQDITNNKQ